jgi:acetoacetyl-CoA reductase
MIVSKVALVTGGTRGIGAAITKALKNQGHHVIATYARNEDAAHQFERDTGIRTVQMDVSSFETCSEALNQLVSAQGGVSILVNNAGITRDALLSKMTPKDWHAVLETNLLSVFYTCRSVLPFMVNQNWGRIINISSINAVTGQKGQTNYAAAKAGLLGFTKSLALEVAKFGVTVNAVAPGYTETEMIKSVPESILEDLKQKIPMRRFGCAEDVANVLSFLVSEHAGYITGQTIHVNGGHLMV